MTSGKKIAVGSDHAGFGMKEDLKAFLSELGYEVLDKGTHDTASTDYPDYGEAVGLSVVSGESAFGVLVCSTGIGISIAANKVKGVRAALVHHAYEAMMSRHHNDANVLCLGANVVGPAIAREAVRAFLASEFEGGRHQRRVDKMMQIEERNESDPFSCKL